MFPKISCVMNTYGRFHYVEQSIAMFLLQDYERESLELIIYNTDIDAPLILDETLANKNIYVINNNTDLVTHRPYDNVGAVRRDSLLFATGDYMKWFDDDDTDAPWELRHLYDIMNRYPDKKAFKPTYSLFSYCNEPLRLVKNSLEASILIDLPTIRDLGFTNSNGGEHMKWYQALSYSGQMVEDDKYTIPSYVYSWSAPAGVSVHRQSGDIGNPDNFENHKKHSLDHATRPLTMLSDLSCLDEMLEFYRNNIDGKNTTKGDMFEANFDPELIEKYVRKYL